MCDTHVKFDIRLFIPTEHWLQVDGKRSHTKLADQLKPEYEMITYRDVEVKGWWYKPRDKTWDYESHVALMKKTCSSGELQLS